MPNNENEKKYVFDKCYENRLRTMLKGSKGLEIGSIKDTRFATTGTGEEETIVGITICKSRLPIDCKLKLVENVLASLEKFPDNAKLLEKLADYTKGSSALEALSVGEILAWTGLGLCLASVILGVIPALLSFSFLCLAGYFYTKRHEDNLMALISHSETERVVNETAVNEQMLTSPCANRLPTQTVSSRATLFANAKPIAQDTASNMQDNTSENKNIAHKKS